ncbi:MAG: MATE family efflux transporter [Clostridiales bacterium]|nr:MATE family efflux transporter [Clostridiales bacterium]
MSKQLGSNQFSYKEIISMLFPLILDQFFITIIGLLTTAMISSSSQESVSAVSLVNPLSMMIYSIFNAIAAGGTVIVAQYKGRGEIEKIRTAAGQVMFATSLAAAGFCILLIIFSNPLVYTLFSAADPIVKEKARNYLVGVSLSFIFHSFYVGSFAIFRGLGETKICLRLTMIINLIHLFASMLFINGFHMDITGTVLSLNIARLIGGGFAVFLLVNPKSIFRIYTKDIFHINLPILKSIFKIGVPFALEQVFFNGGGMLVQTYIVFLGTISVAANAIASSAFSILYSCGMAVSTLSITIVGQCIGAGDKALAKRYGTKMIWLGNFINVLSLVVFMPLMPLILRLYQAPETTLSLIYNLLWIAVIPMPFFWSLSNIMPCVLRSAGDANFSSISSLITMWLIRVGLGYLFALPLGLGVQGVWICMGVEWAIRSVIYYLRFQSDVWLTKNTID